MSQSENTAASHIRLAVPEEVGAISVVLHRAFTEYVHAYTPQAFAATTGKGPGSTLAAKRIGRLYARYEERLRNREERRQAGKKGPKMKGSET